MPSVGLFVPTAAPDAQPNMALAFGQRADAAGLASVWLPERPVFASPEPLVTLAALADGAHGRSWPFRRSRVSRP